MTPAAMAGGAWLDSTHPCPGGNRTDALWRDEDGTLWVGCGTNAVGYGLVYSQDGGVAWQQAPTSPSDILDAFRVSSISRGHDGALYIAGFNAGNRDMVLRLATAGVPFAVTRTLVGTNTLGRQFHVGTYRELADGRAIAESLNGYELLYRPDTTVGSAAADWISAAQPYQILDLVVHDDLFWGVGSRIVEPPRLFLPPTTPAAPPWQFEIDTLPVDGHVGELWGVAVNDARLVGVGVDQDTDDGWIFVSGPDPYDTTDYVQWSLSGILDSNGASWARGVCMRGARIVAVGERQPLSLGTGVVVQSLDGGASFSDITPDGVSGSVSRCVIEPDGTLVVVGAAGYVGILVRDPVIFGSGFEPVQ
ncbi:hypothetical protein [Chiayiivirga flava]|uniref:Exo-alpha-sialidase n=1 Tax=Chiayiivirga flava TaxID=659595 RepID=A0A7W8D835_9GAMM|nr:hypothetical protein [Chiayiivirga flava]MBB5209337.1 hypothetical protein [Chiayiivirga flava]